MITEDFVIIPVEVSGIVPYGIGSVKIRPDGDMTFFAPSGNFFGKEVQEKVRAGTVKRLRLSIVVEEVLCEDKSTTKDREPCAFPKGHRFQGILYCASLGDMDAEQHSSERV